LYVTTTINYYLIATNAIVYIVIINVFLKVVKICGENIEVLTILKGTEQNKSDE